MNKPVAWALITKHGVAVVPDGSINQPKSRGYVPLYTQERPPNTVLVPCDKLAEMQAEIEALKEQLDDWNKSKCNPHPDAPHGFDRNGSHNLGEYVCECESWKPPVKELTDEEIRECIHQIDPNKTDMFMSFARAILRKAQEK